MDRLRSTRALGLILLVFVAVGVGVFLRDSSVVAGQGGQYSAPLPVAMKGAPESEVPVALEILASVPSPGAEEDEPLAEPVQEAAQGELVSNRAPARSAVFGGQLLLPDGNPLRGATLSWSPYTKHLIVLSSDVDLGPWTVDQARFESITRWAETNEQGRFAFMELPEIGEGDASVIWATHPEAIALPILLQSEEESWPNGKAHTLQLCHKTTVKVIDSSGVGVQDAAVTDFALVQPLRSVQTPLDLEETVRVFLRRSYVTGMDGTIAIAGTTGRRQLQAIAGADVSDLWKGQAGEDVLLELQDCFEARGTVRVQGDATPYPGELLVNIEGRTGRSLGFQAQVLANEETLEWGPVRIPIRDEDQFSFSLEAMTLTPCKETIPTPEPGAQVTVDFETQAGKEAWFGLLNEKGETLNEGTLEIDWESHEGQRGTFVRKLRADGYVRLMSCFPGRVTEVRGHSPGYAMGTIPGPEVPEPEPVSWVITLHPAGSLRGTCARNGVPVEDFEVVLWQPENIRNPVRAAFTGAKDGTFLIEEAPLGDVQVLVTAEGYGPSVPVLVRVESGQVAEVQVELNAEQVVRGRVLDELGDPLDFPATVQAYVQAELKVMTKSGDPVTTDRDGAFALHGFAPGLMGVVISSPGYAAHERYTRARKGADFQFGDIRLQALRDLQLKFHFADGTDASLCEVWIARSGNERTASQQLRAEGTAVFHGVGPEIRGAWIQLPDGTNEVLKLPRPTAGEWVAEYQMEGSGSLVVSIGPADMRESLTSAAGVGLASYVHGMSSSSVRSRNLGGAKEVEFLGLVPGDYLLEVDDGGDMTLASSLVTVLPGETAFGGLELDTGDSAFHVVDRSGAALGGVTVSVYATELPLWRHAVTDASGTCTIRGTTGMSGFATLQHPILGSVWDVPVELGQGADAPIELELDARASIRLRITDNGQAVSEVFCRVLSTANSNIELVTGERSEGDGLLEFPGFAKGMYRIQLSGAHIWGRELEVPAVRGSEATSVQVRRLGNLRVRAQSLSGQPVVGLAVELTDSETGMAVGDWIQQGKVQACPASARTNIEGVVDFPAIPRGTYSWRAMLGDGSMLTGSVDVSPGAWAEVVVDVAH